MSDKDRKTKHAIGEQLERWFKLPDRIDQLEEDLGTKSRGLLSVTQQLSDASSENEGMLKELLGRIQEVKEEVQQQRGALGVLARKNQLLEEASKSQERLTEEFQVQQYLKPLGRDLSPLIQALEEGNLVTLDRGSRMSVLNHVRSSLIAVLERQGFAEVACEPGAKFEPRSMRLVGVEHTDSRSEDEAVQECCRPGLELGGEVVVLQEVIVRKYGAGGDGPQK